MMKTKNLLFTAIAILLFITLKQSVKAQTGYYSPSLVNFDVAMNNLLNDYDIPGGQLAITYKGRLVYSRGFGLAESSTNTAVCPDNIFRNCWGYSLITKMNLPKEAVFEAQNCLLAQSFI
jgi:CubicO group peptidase (beta-lactamase class C family)